MPSLEDIQPGREGHVRSRVNVSESKKIGENDQCKEDERSYSAWRRGRMPFLKQCYKQKTGPCSHVTKKNILS